MYILAFKVLSISCEIISFYVFPTFEHKRSFIREWNNSAYFVKRKFAYKVIPNNRPLLASGCPVSLPSMRDYI